MRGTTANSYSFPPTGLSRRDLVMGGAALATVAGAGLTPTSATAAQQTGAEITERAKALLASFSEAQLKDASFKFGGSRFARWNYMTGSAFSPGVPLERMSKDQRVLALDLLRNALSADGFAKAERVMMQQDILRDLMNKGSPNRNSKRFSVMVFGTPSDSELWGWRWEGHHLSLSFVLNGHEVVAVTPNSFSSEPNTVWDGPHKGMVALPEEERIGRLIVGDLSPTLRKTAMIREQSFGNVLATSGGESRIGSTRAGVPLADLTTAQRDLALRLLDVYTSDHLNGPLRDKQKARATSGDLMSARFGFAGDYNTDGASIYYRLHGDTFLIEFASLFGQPLHLHTAVHDLERNLGRHVA